MTPTATALLEHYALFPGVGVGPLRFGDHVADHPDLERREFEAEFEADWGAAPDFVEYTVPGLEDLLTIFVDNRGFINSVGFCECCVVGHHDLIGMGVGELLVVLGLPTAIEAQEVEDEVELFYAYDELGITLWTIDGEVCVVQAGSDR